MGVGFKPNDSIWLKRGKRWEQGMVIKKLVEPRSYLVRTSIGTEVRRNSNFIKKSLLPVPPIKQDNDDVLFDTNNNVFDNNSIPSTLNNVTEQVDVSIKNNKVSASSTEQNVINASQSSFGRAYKKPNYLKDFCLKLLSILITFAL